MSAVLEPGVGVQVIVVVGSCQGVSHVVLVPLIDLTMHGVLGLGPHTLALDHIQEKNRRAR